VPLTGNSADELPTYSQHPLKIAKGEGPTTDVQPETIPPAGDKQEADGSDNSACGDNAQHTSEHSTSTSTFSLLHVQLCLHRLLLHKQVVERMQRTVLFHLVDGRDLVARHAHFDKAIPAVILVGSNFSDVF
jgi:hypothetical protein